MTPERRTIDRRSTLQGIAAVGASAALSPVVSSATARASSQSDVNDAAPATPEPSLYDRLGGIFPIAAVVNRFSDEIITNPKLNRNPALRAWNETEAPTRLPGLKFGRTQWLAALAGGPYTYTGLPLSEAHKEFHLTSEEFAEVGAEIVRALDYYQVPKDLQQELVDAYMHSMPDVVDPNADEAG
jgi:hemoglobin